MTVILLIIATVLWIASLVPAGGMILFLPTLFAAQENRRKPLLYLFVGLQVIYPVVVVLSVIVAWGLLLFGDEDMVLRAAALPLGNLLLFGVVYGYIHFVRGGKF